MIFFENLSQRLNGMSHDQMDEVNMHHMLSPVWSRFATCAHSSAGLAIKSASSAIVKTGSNAFHYTVKNRKKRIAANTDMPALAGTVTNGKFNVFVFQVDDNDVVTVTMGIEGDTEDAIVFPLLDAGKCPVGYIIVNPGGTGNFVGGTTALDNSTVFSSGGVDYVSPVGMWDVTATI